jgi:hypothetical protein
MKTTTPRPVRPPRTGLTTPFSRKLWAILYGNLP